MMSSQDIDMDIIVTYIKIFYQRVTILLPNINIDDYLFDKRQSTLQHTHIQYCTDDIRKKCIGLIPSNSYCTLIITDQDIYPKSFFRKYNFVFGTALILEYLVVIGLFKKIFIIIQHSPIVT